MLCVKAWHELGSARAVGMGGTGSIPWPAVQAWAEAQGLDREGQRLLHAVIAHCEGERIRRENSKAALARATGGER